MRARPSTFYDFCGARATLCGDSRGRGQKTEDFLRFLRCARDPLLFTISAVRARPSAEIRVVEVKKLRIFCDFCGALATRCGDSRGRSRFKNCGLFTISAVRARPSAEIRVVEVQKLRTFYDFCGPLATLCGDRARRSALAVAPCVFVLVSANSLQRLCVSKRSRCGAVLFFLLAKRPLEVVSWFARLLSQSHG